VLKPIFEIIYIHEVLIKIIKRSYSSFLPPDIMVYVFFDESMFEFICHNQFGLVSRDALCYIERSAIPLVKDTIPAYRLYLFPKKILSPEHHSGYLYLYQRIISLSSVFFKYGFWACDLWGRGVCMWAFFFGIPKVLLFVFVK